MKRNGLDQDEEFFVTGLEKYLDAKSAVAMFEKEVQGRVKEVVTKHQRELTKVFGDDWALKDYCEPGMPDNMWLGQRVVFKGSGVLYFYLEFSRDKDGGTCLFPCATFWREKVALLGPLWTELRAIQPPRVDLYNDRFSLIGSQSSNDWASCEKDLDAAIRDWIKLWQKLGGLPKHLPRKAG